jgi:hypothetical protein
MTDLGGFLPHLLLFLAVTLGVGAVNLTLSEPLERGFAREFANYAVVVGGGIAAFTAVIMGLSALFL